ncbi:hypothetical protein [Streptomyces sp. NPDC002676]
MRSSASQGVHQLAEQLPPLALEPHQLRTGRNPRRIGDLLELLVALAIRDGAGEGEDFQ